MARYHRKSAPRPTHSGFKALSRADQHKVRLLAGMLRVGIALDRTYRRAVECVYVRLTGNTSIIDVEAADGRDVDVELFSAEARGQAWWQRPWAARWSSGPGHGSDLRAAERRHAGAIRQQDRRDRPRRIWTPKPEGANGQRRPASRDRSGGGSGSGARVLAARVAVRSLPGG